MRNQPQLITYVDRLTAGTFRDLERLLTGSLARAFGGVHVLPFFDPIDGADAGFDPIDHTRVDPRLGTWDDVRALASHTDIMADVIVNHVSSRSPQFESFDRHGGASPYTGMFLTYSRVFPHGATETDLLALYRPRPGLPFTQHRTSQGGQVLLWTTFASEQVDIDVYHPQGERYLNAILAQFESVGIRSIRLDAVGYAVKRAGTTCFMIPETFDFIADFASRAHARGIEVLVEIHAHYLDQIAIAARVDRVYDFALPPLVLHTLYARDVTALARWLELRPSNAITVLDTHDGIGVLDVAANRQSGHAGLLPADEIDALVETIHERSLGGSRLATGAAANNLDLYQVNCTFYDALGRGDNEYLMARAMQCFVPGVPQIYYVGLLAGHNDLDLLRRTGVGRDINRHYYAPREIEEHLQRAVVQRLMSLLEFRNSHPAFHGSFQFACPSGQSFVMEWRQGPDWARLDVDLTNTRGWITCSRPDDTCERPVWHTIPEGQR